MAGHGLASGLVHQAPSFGRQLAQVRPAVTSAATLYACPANTIIEISSIFICNPAGSAQTFSLYHDDDGTTYGTATALIDDKSIAADDYLEFNWPRGSGIWMNRAGAIGCKTDLADSGTFTLYGTIYEVV